MDIATLLALTPQLIIAAGITLALLLIAWQRTQRLIANFSLVVLLLATIATMNNIGQGQLAVTSLLYVDDYSRFALLLMLLSGMFVIALSTQVLGKAVEVHDEYYLLLLLTMLGASILVVSDHFASLFLGFELLSISLVGLVGYFRYREHAVEGGFKYLILSASASSFMLLGIAFIYAYTGELSFARPDNSHLLNTNEFLLQLGFILFFAGMAFKLSLVPFHYWTPDVYQSAATPVTLLLATISKCAIFVALLKCCFAFSQQQIIQTTNLVNVLSVVAVLSMIAGNSLALKQQSIKRMLAYSSIAHMGYLLIIVLINVTQPQQALAMAWQSTLFYLAAYLLACVSIFTVISFTELNENKQDIELADWHGLFWHKPLLAVLVIVSLLSFAGIPLTAGFIGKFYLINLAANQSLWLLLSALIIGSGIALAYYLPVIFALFNERELTTVQQPVEATVVNRTLVGVYIATALVLGIFPDLLGQWLLTF
ncbi:NADH-quinone oxidoreductase subunit N [Thalassotalea insulae]|uniref:NADH-quinone oxidoreductase subunit N n=1 Tax=Thalassotalea insulae TaxID=2056778 RepID=A0ABQ6GNB8_9GAMM|nr:NADH-quinone oxidoreductase subunit N [Thalassotalea insulae]GLX77503.1 NADH-quinone oxidoreductase subunit N [Thalassotalea insulae]